MGNVVPQVVPLNDLQKLLHHFRFRTNTWSARRVSANPNVDMAFFDSLPDEMYSRLHNAVGFSSNPNLTWEYIMRYPFKGWSYDHIVLHPCVTLDKLLEHFSFYIHSHNPHAHTTPFLCHNPYSFSMNPHVTIDVVLKYPHCEWDIRGLSNNRSIKWRDTLLAPHYNWVISAFYAKSTYDELRDMYTITGEKIPAMSVLFNPHIRLHHLKCPQYNFIFMDTSLALSTSVCHFHDMRTKCTLDNWQVCLSSPCISLRHIEHDFLQPYYNDLSNFDKSIVGVQLSKNPNLTYEFVVAHPEIRWSFYELSSNEFKLNAVLRSISADRIQNAWRTWKQRCMFLKRLWFKDIHRDLLYMPGVGVLYKQVLDNWSKNLTAYSDANAQACD